MKPTKPVIPSEDQVWVTVSYTVNLGNYESAKVEMGTSQAIGDADPSELRQELCRKLQDEVIELGEDMRTDVPRYRRKRD